VRILFAGTAEIGVPTLKALADNFEIGLVLTNPDKPKGRSKKLIPSPIKIEAINLNIPVFQPDRLRGDALKEIASYKCDILICFAFLVQLFCQCFLWGVTIFTHLDYLNLEVALLFNMLY